jgi:hypothetical protein
MCLTEPATFTPKVRALLADAARVDVTSLRKRMLEAFRDRATIALVLTGDLVGSGGRVGAARGDLCSVDASSSATANATAWIMAIHSPRDGSGGGLDRAGRAEEVM